MAGALPAELQLTSWRMFRHYSSSGESRFMKRIKPILTASLILGATAMAATGSAEARHLRHAGGAYAVNAGACSEPAPRPIYIYPAPNWEPFFRRHVYRYGPIVVCDPVVQATHVISVRY